MPNGHQTSNRPTTVVDRKWNVNDHSQLMGARFHEDIMFSHHTKESLYSRNIATWVFSIGTPPGASQLGGLSSAQTGPSLDIKALEQVTPPATL